MNTSFWENIHFGRVVICFGVNRMIIHFSKASDPPSCPYSIHIFLQKILVENSLCSKELNQFSPPNSSDDLCLLTLSVFYGENRFPLLLYLKMARGMPRARECSLRALVFRLPYCPTIRPYMPAPPPHNTKYGPSHLPIYGHRGLWADHCSPPYTHMPTHIMRILSCCQCSFFYQVYPGIYFKSFQELVRKGIPHHFRGIAWQAG